ncbi:MAG: site-2 protease family protein [Candidatus Riflebacteria bacterium]
MSRLGIDISAFLLVIVVHEYFHVLARRRLTGEPVAFSVGNHLDLFGTLLPVCLIFTGYPLVFGWGKRIEGAFAESANPQSNTLVFSMAGMVGNLMLCLATGFFITMIPRSDFLFDLATTSTGAFFTVFLFRTFAISLAVALINLLPVPPFDGGYLFFEFLPARFRHLQTKLHFLSLLIVVSLIVTGLAGKFFLLPWHLITELLCGGLSPYIIEPSGFVTDFLQ